MSTHLSKFLSGEATTDPMMQNMKNVVQNMKNIN